MNQDDLNTSEIHVVLSVELFESPCVNARLFDSALRDLQWSKFKEFPRMYRSHFEYQSESDDEILATCQKHLAAAASSARIVDFEGTVILGLPEESCRPHLHLDR